MSDIQSMLERQAEWQKQRQSLTWPEKIRMVELVRESVKQLRDPQHVDPCILTGIEAIDEGVREGKPPGESEER